jgi:copper(I)-binding protein
MQLTLEISNSDQLSSVRKMSKQDFMSIPAHGKLALKPGSWHSMMIQPKKVPREGDSVVIKLEYHITYS